MRLQVQFRGRLATIQEIAEELGTTPEQIYQRRHHGIPLDKPISNVRFKYEINGEALPAKAWAKKWDVSAKFADRLIHGMTRVGLATKHRLY